MKPVTSNLADRLTRHPARVSFQDGTIEHLCLTDASEEPEIVNIKKGILSVMQNRMDDISKPQAVPEVRRNVTTTTSSLVTHKQNLLNITCFRLNK